MEFSIVENLSGLQESIVTYLEAPNSILAKNQKKYRTSLNLSIFPLSPYLGSIGLLSFMMCGEALCACALPEQLRSLLVRWGVDMTH